MTSNCRRILTVALDHSLPQSASSQAAFGTDMDKIKQMVAAAHEQVSAAGFDSDMIELNPHEHDASIAQLAEKLRTGGYDAVLVGYGVRGNREVTPLFEAIVQTWHEVARQTEKEMKIMFGNTPADVMTTLKRNFADVK